MNLICSENVSEYAYIFTVLTQPRRVRVPIAVLDFVITHPIATTKPLADYDDFCVILLLLYFGW